ncbi:DUF1127 domain-containing protein [Methylobacterium sp. CM6257]
MPTVTLSSSPASIRPAGSPSAPVIWLHRIRTRQALAALHPDQIRDAGLDPWCIQAEIRKPFWRA